MPGSISGQLSYYLSGLPVDDIPGHPEDEVRAIGPVVASASPDYSSGWYEIADLPPGSYQVEADLVGFSTKVVYPVVVEDGLTTQQHLYLSYSGALVGTVRNAATGAPIAGARVVAMQNPYMGTAWGNAATEPDGTYSMGDLQAAGETMSPDGTEHAVVVSAEGYSAAMLQWIRVEPEATATADLELEATGSISVTVHDERGYAYPLAGVLVSAVQTDGVGATDVLVETDGLGQAVLGNLQAPAYYIVRVGLDGSRDAIQEGISVAPGEAVARTFMLPLRPRITGVVWESVTGQPVPGASVYVIGPGHEFESNVVADAEGCFWIYGLYAPAVYTVQAVAPGYLPASVEVSVPWEGEFEAALPPLLPPDSAAAFLLLF
ncbi:MAG: carboxypeptidase regulatory-like domain-containing protein [Armatimonadetes bacterium]|nr:carboxypeptidase regulatory-like domain-containing protein [Armatimonadota bacterium]